MVNTTQLQFLRYCLAESLPLPVTSKEIDWRKMLAWAGNQAIVGIIYQGIQKAGNNLSMPFEILVEWVGYANMIENRNKLLNRRCVEVREFFNEKGFKSCILKGQGNASMYPNPLQWAIV